jgi:hypothetical protein
MKLVYFRPLQKSAVGHEHVNERSFKLKLFINHQLIKIKFTLKDLKLAETALQKLFWVTGDDLAACSATNDSGDRETVP